MAEETKDRIEFEHKPIMRRSATTNRPSYRETLDILSEEINDLRPLADEVEHLRTMIGEKDKQLEAQKQAFETLKSMFESVENLATGKKQLTAA